MNFIYLYPLLFLLGLLFGTSFTLFGLKWFLPFYQKISYRYRVWLSTKKPEKSNEKALSFPAGDDSHRQQRNNSAVACQRFSSLPEDSPDYVKAAFWEKICPYTVGKIPGNHLFPGKNVPTVKTPIWIDYGCNVKIHPSVFINRGVMIFDTPNTTIEIGENSAIGAGSKLIAVEHKRDSKARALGLRDVGSEGRGIKIGKSVRIFADSIILPGSVLGDFCMVAAKSVVRGVVIPPGKFTDGEIIRDIPEKYK